MYSTHSPSGDQYGSTQQPPVVSWISVGAAVGGGLGLAIGVSVGRVALVLVAVGGIVSGSSVRTIAVGKTALGVGGSPAAVPQAEMNTRQNAVSVKKRNQET
jgi:hypothetical protein